MCACRSVLSCFDILVGSFDASKLDDAGSQTVAHLFYYTFNILMVWVLINVFIAIISDSYAQAQEEVRSCAPWPNTHEACFFERPLQVGTVVPLKPVAQLLRLIIWANAGRGEGIYDPADLEVLDPVRRPVPSTSCTESICTLAHLGTPTSNGIL